MESGPSSPWPDTLFRFPLTDYLAGTRRCGTCGPGPRLQESSGSTLFLRAISHESRLRGVNSSPSRRLPPVETLLTGPVKRAIADDEPGGDRELHPFPYAGQVHQRARHEGREDGGKAEPEEEI